VSRLRSSLSLLLAAPLAALALAGCGAAEDDGTGSPKPKLAVAAAGGTGVAALVRDPEEAQSHPLPAGTRGGRKAPLPTAVEAAPVQEEDEPSISPGAPTDAEIEAELKEMKSVLKDLERRRKQTTTAGAKAGLTPGGNAKTPLGAPAAVAEIIAGGNAIARFPYIWGGGHGSFVDSGYDCSGSVSYALAAAGLLNGPLVSGQFAQWGEPGPGRWVTIYANNGHVFMYVAGLRFDTSGRNGPLGSRWQTAPRSLAGFSVRHPPGL
jgi:cell wall-associated NlpC family hydrolase